jgi:hypothetical protein
MLLNALQGSGCRFLAPEFSITRIQFTTPLPLQRSFQVAASIIKRLDVRLLLSVPVRSDYRPRSLKRRSRNSTDSSALLHSRCSKAAAHRRRERVEWEIELALVIAKRTDQIDEGTAASAIAGFTICNDISE